MDGYLGKRTYSQMLGNDYGQGNYTTSYQNAQNYNAVRNARLSTGLELGAMKKAYKKNQQTLKRKGFLNKGIQPEKKVWDTANYGQAVDSAGFFKCVCEPAVGGTIDARIGSKVTVKSIQSKVWVDLGSTQVINAAYYTVQVIYFIDKQPNGALPSITDVLEYQLNTNSSDAMKRALSPLRLSNASRFQVLHDKVYELDAGHGYAQHDQMFKKVSFNITWTNNTTGTVSNISTNAINLLVISGNWSGGLGTDSPIFSHYTRVRYLDV